MRILYAENDLLYAPGQVALLDGWGYSVKHVGSQADAETYISAGSHRIDIGLFDMRMETWTSGVDLTNLMHKECPESPVAILTGYAELDNAVLCMERDAFTYVAKEKAADYLRPALRRAAAERLIRLRIRIDGTHAKWWTDTGRAAIHEEGNSIKVQHGSTALALARLQVPPPPEPDSPEMELETVIGLLPGEHGAFGNAKIRSSLGRALDPTFLDEYMLVCRANGAAERVCSPRGDWAHLDLVYQSKMENSGLEKLNRMLSGRILASDDEIDFSVFPMELTAIGAVAWAVVDEDSNTTTICIRIQLPPQSP